MAETSYTSDDRQLLPEMLQLHGSDHPGIVLVSAPLTGNNYLNWSFGIKRALSAKMKLGFIDGTSVKPNAGHPHFEQWIRVDSMVTTWILNSISKDIVEAFMYTKSSRNHWLDLEQRYGECNGPQLYQLQREICSMTQGNATLSSYFTNMKRLWDEMLELKPTQQCTCDGCTCGALKGMVAFTQLMQFLMGLNDSFEGVRHQILVMDPVPSINKAYAMVRSVEKQKQVHMELSEATENTALHVKGGIKYDKRKYNLDKRSQYCVHCDRAGHSKETCFKLHGTPDWYKELVEKRKRDAGAARGFAVDTGPKKGTQLDAKEELLHELISLMKNNMQSLQPQGNFAHVDDFAGMNSVFAGYGTDILSSWIVDTGATNHMTRSKRIVAVGKQIGNLYLLDNTSFDPVVISSYIKHKNVCFTSQVCNRTLWHRRLGHASSFVLQHIPVIKTMTSTPNVDCDTCPMAKQHRLPFSSSNIRSKFILELIHIDLWGPYKTASLTGCNYFLTVVDDISHATWIFLLKYKSQVHHTLATFFTMVKTQFETSVKRVRSDNGSEFVNTQCKSLFSSLGIIHQTSCVYTHKQNGVVERKHKHILEIARALLFQSHLPKRFWGEAVLTATYILNRLPSSILGWKSPFEMLYQKEPTISILRVFGCLCYATNVSPHKHKFDSRATKCIFLGYSQTQKAYKVYDIAAKVILTSRDVVFHENIFPFQSLSTDSDSVSLPVSILDFEPTPSSVGDHTPPLSPVPTTSETPSPVSHVPDPPIPLRRSQRVTSKPSWLNDYECHCIPSTSTLCIPHSYSNAHMSFVANLSALQEPKSYFQASKDKNWVDAMNQELQALEKNETWSLTSLPPVTVRIFLALVTTKSWPLLQLDVNNAFLHGKLDEEVYMDLPEGFTGAQPGQVCKLQKSLYGLKQASQQWNLELTNKLLEFGFVQSSHEHCLFIKRSGPEFTALLVYVDDILLTGSSDTVLTSVKTYLDQLFTIKDLGPAKYFLGLELARSSHGLHVTQHKYLQDILADTSMLDAKPAPTPFPSGLKLVLEDGALLPDPNRYRRLVGRLLYLGFTRPDIAFANQQLSQFLQAPRTSHWAAALHVLRYLTGTPSTGLFFSSVSSTNLTAYADASWASCLDSRRSITGYCVFLGSSLVSWKTKKQATVSRSSAEAEYRSMASTVCELLWISYLLRDFEVFVSLPIPLWCDNQAALHITANLVFHERTKHLDIDCHLVRDQFKLGFIAPSHVPGHAQLADFFTKSLPVGDFTRFLSKMSLSSGAPS
ncbi:UNVERIFIED_CONTAM: Retrovirus-related Pol polyprotein from transposon RE1 [Sesamum radiatum]|uniref:Retrovirus-related Pol polyprotein from transposon RE1 n=1 Tax=Sesamum radiatum TaxID=300843 RepID=A0AAW2QGJ5_SESRA